MRSFSYENYIIKILTFCSLNTCLQFFKPKYAYFMSKNALFLLKILQNTLSYFWITHIFRNNLFLKEYRHVLYRRVYKVKATKNRLIRYFCRYRFTILRYVLLKIDSEKNRFYLFLLFKTIERDYLSNLIKKIFYFTIHIVD